MRSRKRFLIICGIFLAVLTLSLKIFLTSIYRLPVLMYHSIGYTSDKSDRRVIAPEVFAKQMKYLNDKGYNVIPIREAVRYIEEKKMPPPRTVAITLDDGYEDNYKYAYPVLKRYRIPATIFVITNLVGKSSFMDWDEIKELASSGIVDIESHTLSHPWLTGLDDKKLKEELVESKRVLELNLGKDIDFLCYPMGGYNERVKVFARAAGYKAAFATKPTRLAPNYDIYEIKRVRISPAANNLLVYRIKVSGYHAFFRVIHDDYKHIPYIIWKKRRF